MNPVHLGAVDLNLLHSLDALLVERNVTRAAARVGITQSAMSHALARLRALTGDELLVRGSGGMVPTVRAEALAFPVRRALDEVARALALARLGQKRRVAVAVPHFLIAPHLVASSELVLTLAKRVADVLAAPLKLEVLAPPPELALEGFTMSSVWHDRTHDDPAHRWLREVVVEESARI